MLGSSIDAITISEACCCCVGSHSITPLNTHPRRGGGKHNFGFILALITTLDLVSIAGVYALEKKQNSTWILGIFEQCCFSSLYGGGGERDTVTMLSMAL